jgi:hypothetical protein
MGQAELIATRFEEKEEKVLNFGLKFEIIARIGRSAKREVQR